MTFFGSEKDGGSSLGLPKIDEYSDQEQMVNTNPSEKELALACDVQGAHSLRHSAESVGEKPDKHRES